MADIADQLDQSPRSGLQWERNAHRHPVTKAAMIPGPDGKRKQLRSPSSDFKQHLDNTTNLEKWRQRQIIIGVLAMIERGETIEVPEDEDSARHVLDALAVDAQEVAGATLAAKHGTHTHLTTELDDEGAHWLSIAQEGEDLGLPTGVQAALVGAWEALLTRYGLEVLLVEQPVAVPGVAFGTLDRVARTTSDLTFQTAAGEVLIPAGTVLVLDVKTGKLRTDRKGYPAYWTGYSLQIGHYAHGEPIVLDPDDPSKAKYPGWPEGCEPSKEHALIAHLSVEDALQGVATGRLIYVSLDGYEGMCSTIEQVRGWRKHAPFSVVPDEPDAAVEVAPPVQLVTDAFPGTELIDDPDTVKLSVVVEWLRERIAVIAGREDAKRLFLKHYPDDLPKPADLDIEHLDRVSTLLDRIEAQCEIPFGPRDPRLAPHGHHREIKRLDVVPG